VRDSIALTFAAKAKYKEEFYGVAEANPLTKHVWTNTKATLASGLYRQLYLLHPSVSINLFTVRFRSLSFLRCSSIFAIECITVV
jgi:hypothetical protein